MTILWVYLMLLVRISIRARCTTLCDKVCLWLATGRWFSLCPPVSSTNKTDLHHIAEILLNVALITIKQTKIYCGSRPQRPLHNIKFYIILMFDYKNYFTRDRKWYVTQRCATCIRESLLFSHSWNTLDKGTSRWVIWLQVKHNWPDVTLWYFLILCYCYIHLSMTWALLVSSL
jgi:hypothetical protein